MALTRIGTLPVSAINVGLGASLAGLTAEVTKLTARITDLAPALAAKLQITASFPPSPAAAGVFALNPLNVALSLNPLTFQAAAAQANLDVVAKLGVVKVQLAAMAALRSSLGVGVDAGGISGWSYAGRVTGFGPKLTTSMAPGLSGVRPTDGVTALVFASESFSSWGTLSRGVATGAPTQAVPATAQTLQALGARKGSEWNTGTAKIVARLDGLIAELEGGKGNLEAALKFSLGANLPAPKVLLDAASAIVAKVGVTGLLSNLVNVQADVTGAIASIQAQLDAVLALKADIAGQLSGGGITAWSYTGPENGLGPALTSDLANGMPGGSGGGSVIYALALAGKPPAMTALGSILTA